MKEVFLCRRDFRSPVNTLTGVEQVPVLKEDVNEVEKDLPDGEPTNLFDDPSFETNDPVHVDH